jgi:hypothetical protein
MKSTSAVFVVWSMAAVIAPVFASCPQAQESVQQDAPCRSSERIVLAQSDDAANASAPQPAPQQKANTYQEQRLAQPDGLGFGPSMAGLPGINFYYDHVFDVSSQLHLQLGYKVGHSQSLFSTSTVDVTQTTALVTYRRFFSPNKGFYYGGGLGVAQNDLKYSSDTSYYSYSTYTYSYDTVNYKASGQGVFALAEIGWQGIQGYYFHVGFQPALYLSYNDDYDVSNVPDYANHRQAANDQWGNSKRLSQLEVGFGWFF